MKTMESQEATTAADRKLDELIDGLVQRIARLEKELSNCHGPGTQDAWLSTSSELTEAQERLPLLQTIKTDREAFKKIIRFCGVQKASYANFALNSSNKTIEAL